jgi:hypothetical protein
MNDERWQDLAKELMKLMWKQDKLDSRIRYNESLANELKSELEKMKEKLEKRS